MKFAHALFILAMLAAPPVFAQARNMHVIKDSLYFTMDDGVQSPEEMVEEAEYLLGICQNNAYQKQYFNCECLAGAFLQRRETLGPLTPQQDIMDELTKSPRGVCANTDEIAGSTYKNCMDYSAMSRELATDNEEYCTCAANKAALDFARSPRLISRYIRKIKTNAMTFCRWSARIWPPC